MNYVFTLRELFTVLNIEKYVTLNLLAWADNIESLSIFVSWETFAEFFSKF